jgi:hypothetical protein
MSSYKKYNVDKSHEYPYQQTAGQSTRKREIPLPPARKPLSLEPRSIPDSATGVDGSIDTPPTSGGESIYGAPRRSMTELVVASETRFGVLTSGREQPMLERKTRTLPLELPPYNAPPTGFDIVEDLERQRERAEMKAQKEREGAERKQRALESAFASDDERSVGSVGSDDSEWEEQEALYSGSEE